MRLEHTCTVDGTYKGGGAYIKVGFWQMNDLCLRGLKLGALKWDFTAVFWIKVWFS